MFLREFVRLLGSVIIFCELQVECQADGRDLRSEWLPIYSHIDKSYRLWEISSCQLHNGRRWLPEHEHPLNQKFIIIF
jgi:hypothetical protein